MTTNTEIKSAADIRTWQERCRYESPDAETDRRKITYMQTEIADLRAYAERLEQRVAELEAKLTVAEELAAAHADPHTSQVAITRLLDRLVEIVAVPERTKKG